MKRPVALFIVFYAILSCLRVQAAAAEAPEIASDAAVLMDAATGQVLYEKNMQRKMYPASTTKIMTALLTVENAKPYEIATAHASAIDIDEPASSNIALTYDEELTVESGLYALMLPSANDAANVLAEHVAGTQEAFAAMMTGKAREIGAENTQFTNAHGLHDPAHYTTAYDLALITRYAARNPEFMRYFGASHYTMPSTNKQPQERPFTNYQYMLVNTTELYNEDVIGGKVGFTNEAQHTMSTVARKNGRTLVCVVMHSTARNDKFFDTEKLLDYGFNGFYPYTIPRAEFDRPVVDIGLPDNVVGSASFFVEEDTTILLPNGVRPQDMTFRYNHPDLFESGQDAACSVSIMLDGRDGVPAMRLDIPMRAEITYDAVQTLATGPREPSALKKALQRAPLLLCIAAGAVLLVLFLLVLARHNTLRRRRRQRAERLARRARQAEAEYAAARRGKPPVAAAATPSRGGVYRVRG